MPGPWPWSSRVICGSRGGSAASEEAHTPWKGRITSSGGGVESCARSHPALHSLLPFHCRIFGCRETGNPSNGGNMPRKCHTTDSHETDGLRCKNVTLFSAVEKRCYHKVMQQLRLDDMFYQPEGVGRGMVAEWSGELVSPSAICRLRAQFLSPLHHAIFSTTAASVNETTNLSL